jgi:hypothetical protein
MTVGRGSGAFNRHRIIICSLFIVYHCKFSNNLGRKDTPETIKVPQRRTRLHSRIFGRVARPWLRKLQPDVLRTASGKPIVLELVRVHVPRGENLSLMQKPPLQDFVVPSKTQMSETPKHRAEKYLHTRSASLLSARLVVQATESCHKAVTDRAGRSPGGKLSRFRAAAH